MDLRTTPAGRHPVWTFVISTSAHALHHEQYQSRTPLKQLFFSIRAFVSTIAVLTAALIAPSVYATAPVGATPGSFAVSPSGAATYTIPIVIPPGTNKMQPNISLIYNSQTGNGMLGVGWSISGLSVIHRCGATKVIDGFKGGINYDGNDRFCLDGERLIAIGNNEYRTSHESWQRVIASDDTTNPTSFTVYARDGTIRYYGTTSDSRIAASPPNTNVVRLWALNQIQDRNGNYITITYTQNNAIGEYYPASIAYTGNGAVAPYNFIYFDYETRSDVISYYEAGSLIQTAQRLSGIRICTDAACTVNGSLVRHYYLTYDSNGVVGRSRLTSIQECGTDGVCLPATALMWTLVPASPVGVSGNTSISANPFSLQSADINGDGRGDLVWQDASNSYFYTALALSGTSGFGPAANSGLYVPLLNYHYPFSVGDINGDGISDLGAGLGSFLVGLVYLQYALATPTGLGSSWSGSVYMRSSGGYGPGPTLFADIDGDGRVDAIGYADAAGPYTFYYAFSTGNGFGSLYTTSAGAVTSAIPGDFNGDGRSDLLCIQQNGSVSNFNYALSTGTGLGPCLSTGLSGTPTAGPWPADINGDSKSDLVWIQNNNIYYAFSTGTGFTTAINSNVSVTPVSAGNVTAAELNGDNLPDVVWMGNDGYIYYSLTTGNGFAPTVNSGVAASISSGPWVVDFNGDGKQDLVWLYNGTIYSSLSQGGPTDLLLSVTNGLGAQTTVSYKPLTDNTVYAKDSGSVYPYQDVQNAAYVVASYAQSNGLGGTNTTTATYGGLKKYLTADASLGFRWMQVTDPAGITRVTYFNQTLDGTEGTVAATETWANGVRVKSVGNTWTPVALGSGRTLAQLASTVEETRELNNSVVTTVNASYSGYDAYGNVGSVVVNYAVGGVSDGWTKTTNNTYNNDTVNWQLGQLLQSQVTAQAPGQSPQTRTSSFTYDSLGRLASETIEPNSTTLWLKSVYVYDVFGNRVKKTVSGADITIRDEYILAFDSRSQFATSRQNALGHTETFAYDARNGLAVNDTDANGVFTLASYDGIGRQVFGYRPGSGTTSYTYQACDGTCPVNAVTMAAVTTTGVGTTWVYRDRLGREVRRQTQGFGGAWVYRDTVYDNLGRIASVSEPYYSGQTVYYTATVYDVLNRPIQVTAPGNRVTTMVYNGLSTTVTNPGSQPKTTVKDSQGQVVSVTDAAGTVAYQYDPFGNLLQVTGVDGALTSMTYDLRGRKKTMNDPDMGAWTYGYNVLGELTSQTDAKGNYMYMGYDKLGRLSYRTTPDAISTWTYDTAALGTTGRAALGKLAAVYGNSATETYAYDNLARVSAETASIGGIAYTTSYTYDANSRPLTLAYPETGFTLYHVYDAYGYLTEVHRDSATGTRFWQATGVDARGRLTGASLADGAMTTVNGYYVDTGDPYYSYTTGPNNSLLRYTAYNWDALDNLTWRMWYTGSTYVAENFGYDNLNRLTSVSGPSPKTYAYYPNGNIQSKSDVGTYTYPTNGTRPHAVLSVAGALNTGYTYDGNGNMLSGNGRTISYTSFNKPKTIAKGGITTTLTYDAGFNRLIKSNSSGTTIYIGKLYERLTGGSTVTQKHYIYAGPNLVGAYTKVGTSTNTRYFHTDHLGSVDAITNETGGVVQRLSYDAWGKRRNADGTDATSITAQTTRGFTRHEHDDEVGLINMNAREYDPVLGRFISPDTIVPGTLNSQSYNRYSYVNNNPLSYTDPTGHGWNPFKSVSRAFKKVTRWVGRVADQFKEQVARSTIYALQKVSGVNYVGGLLSTGLLAGTQFGYAYGGSTGDWNSVGRAHATGAVLAGGVWAAPSIAAMPWYSEIGASMGLGYASGYTIAQIYGASNAQASMTGQKGARLAGYASLLFLGYEAVTGMTPEQASNSENTIGSRRGPDNVSKELLCPEGGGCSQKLYDANLGIQATSRFHDPMTGSAGVGFRLPSSQVLADFVNLSVVGDAYNFVTMPIAFLWMQGAYAANLGVSPALIWLQQPMCSGSNLCVNGQNNY